MFKTILLLNSGRITTLQNIYINNKTSLFKKNIRCIDLKRNSAASAGNIYL